MLADESVEWIVYWWWINEYKVAWDFTLKSPNNRLKLILLLLDVHIKLSKLFSVCLCVCLFHAYRKNRKRYNLQMLTQCSIVADQRKVFYHFFNIPSRTSSATEFSLVFWWNSVFFWIKTLKLIEWCDMCPLKYVNRTSMVFSGESKNNYWKYTYNLTKNDGVS